MYRTDPLDGASLPDKVLCLTYDDGPGADSLELAGFLNKEGIRATFFVVGKYAAGERDVLRQIASLGHLIGNHTYDHPDLPYYLSVDGDVHDQIRRTDALLKEVNPGQKIFFRSPYGKWSPEVAEELNRDILSSLDHIGPIHWDVTGIDCDCWKRDLSVEATAALYLEDVRKKGRGIVVMHDGTADMEYLNGKNQTLALTRHLVPLLKEQGYSFVRLDDIESIRKESGQARGFSLKSRAGNSLAQMTVRDMGRGKFAFMAASGLFFSLGKDHVIEAVSDQVSDCEMFDLIPISSGEIMLRAFNGRFLCLEDKGERKLVANAEFMRGAERFEFEPLDGPVKKSPSWRERYRSLKRQLRYVKTKIEQNAG